MTLLFIYIPHNVSIEHLPPTPSLQNVDCWLQMCTLCQSPLYLSQTLFEVMCQWCKTPHRGLAELLLFSFTSKDGAVPPPLSVFNMTHTNQKIIHMHTHTFFLFIHFFYTYIHTFSVFLWESGVNMSQTLFATRNTPNWRHCFFSNEIHPDDVGMNIFMSDTQEKQDGGTRAAN